jgi:hypothetical protein
LAAANGSPPGSGVISFEFFARIADVVGQIEEEQQSLRKIRCIDLQMHHHFAKLFQVDIGRDVIRRL